MLVLGIETSVGAGSIALCRDGACLEEVSLEQPGRRAAQTLIADIATLLGRFSLQPGDCDAVAVSVGPGSFTGLRVGVVCAKTFAYATRCAVAGVDTYLAIAENAPEDVHNVFVIGNAQRRELFVGKYRREPRGCWKRIGEIAIVDGAGWCKERKPEDVVSGPGIAEFDDELNGVCRVLDTDHRLPRAAVIASLGLQQINSGDDGDCFSLKPFYLRKSAAEEKWDARV